MVKLKLLTLVNLRVRKKEGGTKNPPGAGLRRREFLLEVCTHADNKPYDIERFRVVWVYGKIAVKLSIVGSN